MRSGDAVNRRIYRDFKSSLFKQLRGVVLDLGAGTGLNLAHAPQSVTKWIAAEPNAAFHTDIRSEAEKHRFKVEISSMDGHKLDLPDESVDGVVCTLVLCSVESPDKVLSEIARVLIPGAPFIFIEHVASDKKAHKFAQDVFNPLNRIIADGCNCNRDTLSAIHDSGLKVQFIESRIVKGITWFHSPHVMGVAIKPNK